MLTMKMGKAGEKLIKGEEQCRLKAYKPTPNDKWTLGYGSTKGVKEGDELTQEEAEQLFLDDIAWAAHCVNKYVEVPLTQNQFDALVSFTFNIGETEFRKSTLLNQLNQKNYVEAGYQFMRWIKQRQPDGTYEVLPGLVRRRKLEKDLFCA